MKASAARLIATWFGCGLSPFGPGTIGSLAAVLIGFAVQHFVPLTGWQIALAGVALFLPAVWSSGITARQLNAKDPGLIVVDEVVGQWIAMAGAGRLTLKTWFAGFLLFRFFDILKPPPLRRLECLPGGWGIVADDAGAGIYAALALSLMWFTF